MNKKKLMPGILVILGIAFVLSCAPSAAPAPQSPAQAVAPAGPASTAPAVPAARAPARQAWEEEWDNVVQAARKEGGVVLYATIGEYRPQWSAAMAPYGIRTELIVGPGTSNAAKILAERRAGIYSADFYTGGTTTAVASLKPKGALEPMDDALILPEVKDPKMWYLNKLPFLDNDHTLFNFTLFPYPAVGINTNLVKPGEIKSYNDILDPKFRGKVVVLDPTRGTGQSFVGVIGSQVMGWDYIRKLVANQMVILNDERQRIEWLAQGKVSIALAPQSVELDNFKKVGAPVVALIPQEGGWLSAGTGCIGMMNRPAHPNAAKVFINWLLGKESQTIYSKISGSQSARVDVPTDHLDPVLVRDPSKKYFVKDTEDYLLVKQEENTKIIREIFKDLLK